MLAVILLRDFWCKKRGERSGRGMRGVEGCTWSCCRRDGDGTLRALMLVDLWVDSAQTAQSRSRSRGDEQVSFQGVSKGRVFALHDQSPITIVLVAV